MKAFLAFVLFFSFSFTLHLKAQNNVGLQWQRVFGGSLYEEGTAIAKTNDAGFIVASVTDSYDGDVSIPNKGLGDIWIIKFNKTGAVEWKRTYGGSGEDAPSNIIQTNDGGYLFIGSTSSNNGDVSGNKGPNDIWVVKLFADGSIAWQRTLGGSNGERAARVVQTNDSGYIIASTTSSSNGDVIGHPTSPTLDSDIWVVKINSAGQSIIWQKIINDTTGVGAYNENLRDMALLPDGGVVLTGSTQSVGGDYPALPSVPRIFMIKIDGNGNKVFVKFAVQSSTHANSVLATSDNGFYIGGRDSLGNNYLFKANSNADIFWEKAFKITQDGSHIISEMSYSLNSEKLFIGGSSAPGLNMANSYILQLDTSGNLEWAKRFLKTGRSSVINDIIVHSDSFPLSIGTTRPYGGVGLSDTTDMILLKIGPSNNIVSTLFYDENLNGIRDVNEKGFNNAIVKSVNTTREESASLYNGISVVDVDTGSYITTVQLFNPYYSVAPSARNSSFNSYFNTDSFSFAIQPIPNKQDIIVHLLPVSPARPGFKAQYVLNYKNIGTTTMANGTVKLIKDSRTAYSFSLPLPASIVADTITWNYANLKPLDSIAIGIELQLAAPPALNNSDTLKYKAIVLPVTGDLTPLNDTSSLKQLVQGSYDPNDKQESFAGRMPLRTIQDGAYINYMIRFQNTGNDTAFTVRLLDTLEHKLDWSSFEMIGSSHKYSLTKKEGNKLQWVFNDIKLPDSTTNLIRSVGFVAFRIKPKNTVATNDVIKNKASIYFDYNLPIVTNSADIAITNEIITAVREIQNDEMKLQFGPNPSNGYSNLMITGKLKGKFDLRIIDNSGSVISQQTITRNSIAETNNIPVQLEQLSSGVYYIQLQQKGKSWWQKIILQ